jgi:hypothetical protein
MAGQDRAITAVWNVGIETVAPSARVTHGTWNVGIEPVDPTTRAIHGTRNVGIEILAVLMRAIHAGWNVKAVKDEADPPDWILVDADLVTVKKLLKPE